MCSQTAPSVCVGDTVADLRARKDALYVCSSGIRQCEQKYLLDQEFSILHVFLLPNILSNNQGSRLTFQ